LEFIACQQTGALDLGTAENNLADCSGRIQADQKCVLEVLRADDFANTTRGRGGRGEEARQVLVMKFCRLRELSGRFFRSNGAAQIVEPERPKHVKEARSEAFKMRG